MAAATLDELLDRQAIVDVAYCWALDSRTWDGLDAVFAPGAHAELGRPLDGVEAIKARVRKTAGASADETSPSPGSTATLRCWDCEAARPFVQLRQPIHPRRTE